MEASGRKFYNSSGTEQDCIGILKDLGMNSVRLRIWVNPQDCWNDTDDVVAKTCVQKTSTLNAQCLTNMNDMFSRYNKEVMVVEVGMSWDQATACSAFLTDYC
jgi:arabinogalactan endo-1,4-beta-galactosidase